MTKPRWLVVLVVVPLLILVALGIAGVYLYSRGVEGSLGGPRMGVVVVSEVDIPARTDLNELIKHDQFRLIQVLEDTIFDGAVTSIDQLRGKQNRVRILANEWIPANRLKPA